MADETLPATQKEYKSVLDLVTDVREEDVIKEPRCKMCNWEHRVEAEQYWEAKRRQHSTVVRFCEDRGFRIDDKSVANHMFKHYAAQQKKLAIKDYAEKLKLYEQVSADLPAGRSGSRSLRSCRSWRPVRSVGPQRPRRRPPPHRRWSRSP